MGKVEVFIRRGGIELEVWCRRLGVFGRLSLLCLFLFGGVEGRDFFELPPIEYSKAAASDEMAIWQRELEKDGGGLKGLRGKALLREVLKRLDIPEESQVLVFSKTSLQHSLIGPTNPRAIYFSMNAYVGWMPGGDIEVIVEDEKLGPVFYLLKESADLGGYLIQRETHRCLSCHATSRTSGVPGVFVRSVIPDREGHARLNFGSTLVTDLTPVRERWGGWYVTGNSDEGHLGNRFLEEDLTKPLAPEVSRLRDLGGMFPTDKYLRPTSDIVALMVLEHQCRIHNLMTSAKLHYRRAEFLRSRLAIEDRKKALKKVREDLATQIVGGLLFQGEVDPGGDGVSGGGEFEKVFRQRGMGSKKLRQFRLYGRMFKYRCSYMIYSKAFRSLPADVKREVFIGLKEKLRGGEGRSLGEKERRVIFEVLSETVEGFKES